MPKSISLDLIGMEFGLLTVIERSENRIYTYKGKEKQRSQWKCKCTCGNEIIAVGNQLTAGDVKSCGCLHSFNAQFHTGICDESIIGKKINNLTVLERDFSFLGEKARSRYRCICDCGSYCIKSGPMLRSGRSKSCGCLLKKNYKNFKKKEKDNGLDSI